LIKDETGLTTELVEGDRGEFTVWVGEKSVASKDANGFPEDSEILSAVRQALQDKT
jgi:hypothetical protein